MIEVIYKDEKQTAKGNEESFNLPKNIRQIGIPNEDVYKRQGKSIELHMLVAEDHQQTNLTQITVDQAIRENIHMDVVIEETPGSEPEE